MSVISWDSYLQRIGGTDSEEFQTVYAVFLDDPIGADSVSTDFQQFLGTGGLDLLLNAIASASQSVTNGNFGVINIGNDTLDIESFFDYDGSGYDDSIPFSASWLIGRGIGEELSGFRTVAFLHFARQILNPTVTYDEIVVSGADGYAWIQQAYTAYHRFGFGNENNFKVTSLDGHQEYIFRFHNGNYELVTDATNSGSYNFSFGPDLVGGIVSFPQHNSLDIIPWRIFGNEVDDQSTYDIRTSGGVDGNLPDLLRRENLFQVDYQLEGTEAGNILIAETDRRTFIFGYGGDDVIHGGPQHDTIDGGDGADTVSFENSNAGVAVNLGQGFAVGGWASRDYANSEHEVLISVENVIGSNYSDILVGSTVANLISGGNGNDHIYGEAGNDTLNGNYGDDLLHGGSGNDSIVGGQGTDTAYYDGTVNSYSLSVSAEGGIEVTSISSLDAGTDLLVGIEKLSFGGSEVSIRVNPPSGESPVLGTGDYWIFGNNDDNYITDGDGNDTVWGNEGDDEISFGLGGESNVGYGGIGNDRILIENGSAEFFGGDGDDHAQINVTNVIAHIDGGNGFDTMSLFRQNDTLGEVYDLTDTTGIEISDGSNFLNIEEIWNLHSGAGDDTYIRMMASDGAQHVWNAGAGLDTFILDASNFDHVGTTSLGLNISSQWILARTAPGGTWEPSRIQLFNVEVYDLILSSGDDFVRTADYDDTVIGGAGNDEVFGEAGNDSLYAGTGSDSLNGGVGNDFLHSIADGSPDLFDGGSGIDRILLDRSDLSGAQDMTFNPGQEFALSDGTIVRSIELLELGTGSADDTLRFSTNTSGVHHWNGNGGYDTAIIDFSSWTAPVIVSAFPNSVSTLYPGELCGFVGDAAGNGIELFNIETVIVLAGAGNDVLSGGAGETNLSGGLGNDTYSTDGGDIITEAANAGTDRVNSSVSYLLGANLENLVLTGTAAISGTGNTLANRITGNAANNVLNGGSGVDVLIGGLGNDIYITDGGDTITEAANAGTDAVRSSVSYTLGANVERLVLSGTSMINGIGNSLTNRITGNSADNTINGGAGADTLIGGAGADSIIGGAGRDLLSGSVDTNRDVLIFRNTSEIGLGSTNRDVIYNFVSGTDDISLTGIDASTTLTGNQAFSFNGTTSKANAIWLVDVGTNLVIRGDVNGNKIADFEIQVSEINTLLAGDFLL